MAKAAAEGRPAPDFVLPDQDGKEVRLYDLLEKGPVMLVFYPGDYTPVCTIQLRGYRNRYAEFEELGIQILGISDDPVERHQSFSCDESFPFPLLADPTRRVIDLYCGSSLLTGGHANRANYVVSREGIVRYAHVEKLAIFHRKPGELIGKLRGLKRQGLL